VSADLILNDKSYPDYDTLNEIFEKVYIRFNGEGGRWLNSIADLLSDDTKVWALDNSPQGIYTIGDIKKEIKCTLK
jgi:hypothetical protein